MGILFDITVKNLLTKHLSPELLRELVHTDGSLLNFALSHLDPKVVGATKRLASSYKDRVRTYGDDLVFKWITSNAPEYYAVLNTPRGLSWARKQTQEIKEYLIR